MRMANETRWKVPWAQRPVEEARIFNPAFCGELIGRTVCEYHRPRQAGLGVAIAFVVLPLTLHRPTRDALPRLASKTFVGWVAEHEALLAELPGRCRYLRPVSREALMFAVRHQLLTIDGDGLVPGKEPVRLRHQLVASTDEADAIRRAAGLLGRWFSRQNSQTSILQGMGVTP